MLIIVPKQDASQHRVKSRKSKAQGGIGSQLIQKMSLTNGAILYLEYPRRKFPPKFPNMVCSTRATLTILFLAQLAFSDLARSIS